MRLAARVDENQSEIVAVLRRVGASVASLAAVGRGVPDLIVGYYGVNLLMETKNERRWKSRRRLRPSQQAWRESWKGQYERVESPLQALRCLERNVSTSVPIEYLAKLSELLQELERTASQLKAEQPAIKIGPGLIAASDHRFLSCELATLSGIGGKHPRAARGPCSRCHFVFRVGKTKALGWKWCGSKREEHEA